MAQFGSPHIPGDGIGNGNLIISVLSIVVEKQRSQTSSDFKDAHLFCNRGWSALIKRNSSYLNFH